jgi:hypothetical protein
LVAAPSGERFPSGQREQTVNLPAYAFGGSNPPLSTNCLRTEECGSSSVGRARAFQARGRGFESRLPLQDPPVGGWPRLQSWFGLRKSSVAHVAQSVEHFLGKEEVMGSIPVMGFETFASNIRFEGCRVK